MWGALQAKMKQTIFERLEQMRGSIMKCGRVVYTDSAKTLREK